MFSFVSICPVKIMAVKMAFYAYQRLGYLLDNGHMICTCKILDFVTNTRGHHVPADTQYLFGQDRALAHAWLARGRIHYRVSSP